MKKRGFWDIFAALAVSAALALELTLLADAVVALLGGKLDGAGCLVLLAVLAAVLFIRKGKRWKRMLRALVWVSVSALAAAAVLVLCWSLFSRGAVYESRDDGKALLYGGQKVMLIVPHEDDDINVLGGVTEEYVRYGSDVYVVFVSNGDYYVSAERRMREALAGLANAGVSSDHVIFLGYGDQWAPDGPHLYNAAPGQALTSYGGFTQVYGTSVHEAYREGRDYTIDHLLEDLQDVILEYLPDVIFAVDYDESADHRAVCLSFDRVMGRILRQTDYHPRVYRGFAYSSAWLASPDFLGENIRSTQNVYTDSLHGQEPAVYRWEDRIRLPVQGDGLSRSLVSTNVFESLRCHYSQRAWRHGENVVNGDKVFWRRDTGSLCYTAQVEVSSGDGARLNDFMLIDNLDLTEKERRSYDGSWLPDTSDPEKTVRITLAEPSQIQYVTLYDHPDPEQNVTNARITLSDGTALDTGALDPGGAATVIPVNADNVSWFTLAVTEWEGDCPGLAEVEAFASDPEPEKPLVKLMDGEENFLYDYWTPSDGEAELKIYAVSVDEPSLELSWSNPNCQVERSGSTLRVTCPKGESCVLTVSNPEGTVSDTILVRNPGSVKRAVNAVFQRIEQAVLRGYPNMVAVRIPLRVLRSLRIIT